MSEVSVLGSDEALQIIEAIAADASKLGKQAKVSAAAESEEFVRILKYAYDPFITFGVQALPNYNHNPCGEQFDEGTWNILDNLAMRHLTGAAAFGAIQRELERLTSDSAELLKRILRKNLRAGFSESTINKAVKGLIPEFAYMRCSLPKDADLASWPWAEGVISQEKADGMFDNLDYWPDGSISMRTRQGNELPVEKFKAITDEIIVAMEPGFEHHGEIVVERNGVICKREDGNGVLNPVISGGDFAANERPVFMLWDRVPLANVRPKGSFDVPYKARLVEIVELLLGRGQGAVRLIPTRIVRSLAEAYKHAGELMKQGKEGTVIKHPAELIWKDGTSKWQVKLKLEFEVDLEIVGILPGKEGTKNEGRPGTFACVTSDRLLSVDVTVKNEKLRDAVEANPDDFIGRILTVVANDITLPSESNELHSLFLPRMAEGSYRIDKTTADSLQQVFDQKEAAILGQAIKKAA